MHTCVLFRIASVRKTAMAAIKKQNFQKPSKAKKIACFQDGSRVQAPGVLPTKNKLRELFYDRNPGDARVKVGSERQAASSHSRPTRPTSLYARSALQQYGICPRGPSKSGPVIWVLCFFNPKVAKMRDSTWDFRRFGGPECGKSMKINENQ